MRGLPMQTVHMGSHIRDFAWLGRAVKAEITRSRNREHHLYNDTARALQCSSHVRFGSKADIRTAIRHVRFTPNSDRERGFPQTVMSALPPIADMCSVI